MSDRHSLLYNKRDKIVTITLNRPDKMNALDEELSDKVCEALERFENDDDAIVAIVTGAGNKAFSAGGDLNDAEEIRSATSAAMPNWHALDIEKPMIAAINGFCLTLGWLLAQKCDIRIAAEEAQFGITSTRFNFSGSFAHEVARMLQPAHALEIMLWGDALISAQRAYEIGWLNRVVPGDRLMDEAWSWAERMIYLAPRSVRNIKKLIRHGQYMNATQANAFAEALSSDLATMEDTQEGIRAFLEKRKPIFRNK